MLDAGAAGAREMNMRPTNDSNVALKFLASAVVGIGFFLWPIRFGGQTTVMFDILVNFVTGRYPQLVASYCFGLILVGALATILSGKIRIGPLRRFLASYESSLPFSILRVIGLLVAAMIYFRMGPTAIFTPSISHLMWETLTFSVGVIIPLGAIFLNIFISYGCLEFVGTLMRPLMRPLFRLPGRAALDALTSWLGSYSIGLYMTRRLFELGYYNRREAYTIATCFSTVSIGFVAVVAATLDVLRFFPLLFLTYFFAVYALAAVLTRGWPIARVPETYLVEPHPEEDVQGPPGKYWRWAWERALNRAASAPGWATVARAGFLDGLKLASTILGTILSIGTSALLVAEHTPVFFILGTPFIPLLEWFGFPSVERLASATVAGITEMYIPALLLRGAPLPARFFIAVLSISQLIFFSSVGPMILDMFKDIPVRFYELVALFFIRTLLLIPPLAALTMLLTHIGWL